MSTAPRSARLVARDVALLLLVPVAVGLVVYLSRLVT
jgi:hypothetical protein